MPFVRRRLTAHSGGIKPKKAVNQVMSKANVPKSVPISHETGRPEKPPGPLLLGALERFWSNNLVTDAHHDADVTGRSSSVASPARHRRRITDKLRADLVDAYESGQTSRQVADELALGRTTVLKILKDAGVTVRPQGRKY
jgi:hypothetical protein